jgi:hypothetical protein
MINLITLLPKRSINRSKIPALICFAIILFSACRKSDFTDAGTSSTSLGSGAKKHVIMGTIYNAQGKKFNIPNAIVKIHIYANGNIGETDPLFNVKMDANSHYEIEVPNNVYAVNAWAEMSLNGSRVMIDLKPLDDKPSNINLPSAPGIVRDFALQLTGEIPGGDASTIQGYYGAKIWFGDGKYNFSSEGYWENLNSKYPNAKVQFTFTPGSPLIDGTPGQTITKEATTEELKNGKWFVNVPYALYKVSALLLPNAGRQQPLGLTIIPNISAPANSVDLTFPLDKSDPFGRPQKAQVAVW